MPSPKHHSLDVRPRIGKGDEPFALIRSQVDTLASGDTLTVIAPFLPSPLIELLKAEGFEATMEHRADGAWSVGFKHP